MLAFAANIAALVAVAVAAPEWSLYDGTGCEYAILGEPVSWFRAARVCHEQGDNVQLSSVWSAGEARHIANIRNSDAAWVFGFYENGGWNLNLDETKLWSPAEPKDESAFAFCARQADDSESSIRFQSASCSSEYAAVCKRCPTKAGHFVVSEEVVVQANSEAYEVEEARERRQAATTTTTTTTTTTPEPAPVVDSGGDPDAVASTSDATSAPLVAAIVCVAATVVLVGAAIVRNRAIHQAHMQDVADKFVSVLEIEPDTPEMQLEWADDDLGFTIQQEYVSEV